MNSFLRYPLQPLANLSSLMIARCRPALQQNQYGRQQQFYFSATSSDINSSKKQGRIKRKKKPHPSLQLLEVPDFLIPLAYRQPSPERQQKQQQQQQQQFHPRQIIDEGKKRNSGKHHESFSSNTNKSKKGVGFASLFSRPSSPSSSPRPHHSVNSGTNHSSSSSRHRRRSGSHTHRPLKYTNILNSSQSAFGENVASSSLFHNHQPRRPPMDGESLRQMEKCLNEKMSDYIRIRGGIGGSGSTDASTTIIIPPEESSTSYSRLCDEDNTPVVDAEFYNSVVIDYYSIILGWCEVAESICQAQWTLNSTVQGFATSDVTTTSTAKLAKDELAVEDTSSLTEEAADTKEEEDLLSKYEDAMCRAMRHLDSLEGLYRTNGSSSNSSIDPSTRMIEKEVLIPSQEESERGMKVVDDFASFMGKIFFGPKPDLSITVNNDDKSASTKQKDVNPGLLDSDGQPRINSKARNRDVQLITSLYEHIILAHHSSHCFGGKVQRKSTQKSNQLLKKWIPLYCCSSSSKPSSEISSISKTANHPRNDMKTLHETIHPGNEYEDLGARNIFHTVIRQNAELTSSIEGVKRAEYWLSSMHSLAQAGCSNCAPDVDTYNLVLLGYCNLCKTVLPSNRSNNSIGDKSAMARRRQFIIEAVERVLLQLVECNEASCNANITSLNLALSALAKAGRHSPKSICQKTSSLLLKLMGEEQYRNLVKIESHDAFINESSIEFMDDLIVGSSNSNRITSGTSSKLHLEPNLDTYHWLVDIYSTSSDVENTMRSLSLLRKMIRIRNKESQTASASFAPSTGTHCKVLRALLSKVDDLSVGSIAKIAKEMTQSLDSMVLHGSSFPNHIVYLSLLQLWQKSRAPEAGQYAEEILSRMEISGMYQNDLKISSGPYFIALSCWLTSAMAGRSDAAERAYRLLNIMEARTGKDDFFSSSRCFESYDAYATSDVLDRSSDHQIQMYTVMLRICAATHENLNSSQAMSIAFEIYDKMVQCNIKPGPKTFELIYKCVQNFLDQHPEAERQVLLQKVYKMANKHGLSRGELLGRYKESLRRSHVTGKA